MLAILFMNVFAPLLDQIAVWARLRKRMGQCLAPSNPCFFATMLCVICSVLLTAASTGLQGMQQRNMAVDRHKNILLALGFIAENASVAADEIERLYRGIGTEPVGGSIRAASWRRTSIPPATCPFTPMSRTTRSRPTWCPLTPAGCGAPSMATWPSKTTGSPSGALRSTNIPRPPGWGARSKARWFRKNFQGKKITDQQGDFVSIRIAKGKADEVVPPPQRPQHRGRHQRCDPDRQVPERRSQGDFKGLRTGGHRVPT